MAITAFKIGMLISMVIAIITLSFIGPAIGMSGDNVTTSEIPEYNASEGLFEFALEQPEQPSRPSQGTLRYVDNQQVNEDNRRVWIRGNSDEGIEITLTNNGTLANPIASLFLNEYNNSAFVGSNSTELTESETFAELERSGYIITFENPQFDNKNESDMTMTVDWEIIQTPAGASTIGQIPIIGVGFTAIANAIEGIIAVIGYIGDILFYYFVAIGVTVSNVLVTIFNITTFVIDFMVFIIVSYSSMIANAPSNFVSVFLTVPLILFSLLFADLVMELIKILPTT